MPIRIKTDLEFGDIFYLKVDPDQLEHMLTAVIIMPSGGVKFRLSWMGEECEVWDFEATKDIDEVKKLTNTKDEE